MVWVCFACFNFFNPMKELLKQSSSKYLSNLISTMEAFLLLVRTNKDSLFSTIYYIIQQWLIG